LRQAGLPTQPHADPARLREQIKCAATKGIPIVLILGPDKVATGRVTVRDLRTRRQKTVAQTEAVGLIRAWLM
jgi:histidyl-tRNA synthetase